MGFKDLHIKKYIISPNGLHVCLPLRKDLIHVERKAIVICSTYNLSTINLLNLRHGFLMYLKVLYIF